MSIKTRKVDVILNGEIVKKDFEIPEGWTDRAATIMATKYATDKENSALQIIDRVVKQITQWGKDQGYFKGHNGYKEDEPLPETFADRLTDILVNQRAAFNSPVWFNIGVEGHLPQASACFIIPVEDTMEDILAHNTREGLIFRSGSGSGTNVSKLRAKGEKLSNKGESCFPGDTKILTTSGLIQIQNIIPLQHKAILHDGEYLITALHKNGKKPILEITFNDGRIVRTTQEHQFFVMTNCGEVKKLQLKEVLLNTNTCHPIFVTTKRTIQSDYLKISSRSNRPKTHKHFEFVINPEIAWLLGHHAGDGHTSRGRKHSVLGFTSNINERSIQTKIKRTLEKLNLHVSVRDTATKGRTDTIVADSSFVDILDQNNLLKQNSANICIPVQILESNYNVRLAYLSGWLDADACITGKRIRGKTICRTFAYELQELFASVGIKATLTTHIPKKTTNKQVYLLEIVGDKWKRIFFDKAKEFCVKIQSINIESTKTRLGQWNFNALKCLVSNPKIRAKLSKFIMPYNATTTSNGTAISLHNCLVQENQIEDANKVKEFFDYSICKIKSVKELGIEEVYDISVEDKHRYITNGILVSNSGPISFMRTWDASAGSIKSGGKNRRSAKMICMDVDHPDIEEFITCKKAEEDKARILVAGGIELEEAKSTICFQNTNHSIMVNDEFMEFAKLNTMYPLFCRGGNKSPFKFANALDVLQKAAEMTWHCGDPGILYYDRVNKDNPVPSMGDISCPNPCGEHFAIDNSSCNLASLNLIKYSLANKNAYDYLDGELFRKDIQTLITAMDILIEPAHYPMPEVRATTLATRPLGLGFTNLGALLMQWGIAYDSDEGRKCAADITRAMTTHAYGQSIKLAEKLGSYPAFANDANVAMDIADRLTESNVGEYIKEKGLRNSQLTLLAPTGTISFMMDCETTGIEPFLFEESEKKCVDGSVMKISSPSIETAKKKYRDTVPGLYKTAYGEDHLSWKAHLDMMAACQPYLNGAISKTVALPNSATVDDIFNCYVYGWNKGLKAIAIYRDGSKIDQPVSGTKKEDSKVTSFVMSSNELVKDLSKNEELTWTAVRRKLPDTRYGPNHKFDISGFEGYVNCGTFQEGNLGEIFIIASKSGETMRGILDSFATAVSIGLQYGVPLKKYVEKFTGTRFDPAGFTKNPDIRMCSSVIDYIFRWLSQEFLEEESEEKNEAIEELQIIKKTFTFDGPNCQTCGGITQRAGSCFTCSSCGSTNGCS